MDIHMVTVSINNCLWLILICFQVPTVMGGASLIHFWQYFDLSLTDEPLALPSVSCDSILNYFDT